MPLRTFSIIGYCIVMVLLPASRSLAQTMKAPVEGLVDMQDISFYRGGKGPAFTLGNVEKFPGQFGGIVLNVTWRELQPAQNGPLVTVPIDNALVLVRAYNSNKQNGARPLGIKLRVWGGFMAPTWAKNLAGGSVSIPDLVHRGKRKGPETIGRYWTAAYRQAWRALQSQLAARYDQEALIQEVSVTSCAWATDEPFVQWIGPPNDVQNFTNLSQAGYTAGKEIDCLREAPADYAAWKTTYLDYPFNPLQMYLPAKDTGKIHSCQHVTYGNFRFCHSNDLSAAVMIECAQSHRCILSNQALKSVGQGFPYDVMDKIYNADNNVLIDFQTASPQFVSGWVGLCTAVTAAKSYHARSVELWPSAFTSLSSPQIALLANTMDGQRPCDAAN